MKKLYILLLTAIAGGIISYFIFFTGNKNNQLGEFFTPAEFYEYEMQQKKLKKESKADKPDEFTKYFKNITTRFNQEKDGYPQNYRVNELKKSKEHYLLIDSTKFVSIAPFYMAKPEEIDHIITDDDAIEKEMNAGLKKQ